MEYQNLISQFDTYTTPYLSGATERIFDALQYKISHSRGVANIASNISIFVFPSERHQLLAKTCGLFHDIARFEQMKNFNTFVDAKSFDHGEKAVEIIQSQNFLIDFDLKEQKAILNAIRQHNKKTTPTGDDEIELALAKIIRDADKIDTLNSIADYYESKDAGSKKALELDLPDIPQVSEKVIQQLQNAQMVNYADINTVDDFKLLKISWIYDINYAASLAMVLDSQVLKRIFSTIKTKDDTLNMLFGMAYGYAEASASF
jgi:putative nucleotidyltransferase with HDIG domain